MLEPSEVDKHLLLFVRGLRLVEPRQGPLIAGLVGLAAGAGLGGLLLVYGFIVSVLMGERSMGVERFCAINIVGFVGHGIVLWLWVNNWNRIRRAPTATRRAMVVVCWAMPLAFVVVFATYIR